jgi:molybdopterin-containing oxidoreductase family membrane subunit
MRMSKRKVPINLWIIFALILVLGIPGLYDRLVHKHIHANYGQFVTWGLWVASYVFFMGISAGAFLLSTLVYVFGIKKYEPLGRVSLFTALVTLLGALLLIISDLGHPIRAFRVFLTPNFSSVMVWVIWLYIAYALILIGELWLLMWADLKRSGNIRSVERDKRIVKILGIIGTVFVICASLGSGSLFGVLGSKSFWHTGLFPITFFVSAVLSGGALIICISPLFIKGGENFRKMIGDLAKLVGGILVIELFILISEAIVTLKGGIPSDTVVLKTIMWGPFAWVFWGLQIIAGTFIPLFLLLGRKRITLRVATISSLLILMGVFAFRLNIVIPQLTVPALEGLPEAYYSSRTVTYYVPSLTEWALFFFAIGIMGLIFLIGYRILPLIPSLTTTSQD